MIKAEDVREPNVQILDGKMPKTGRKKKSTCYKCLRNKVIRTKNCN